MCMWGVCVWGAAQYARRCMIASPYVRLVHITPRVGLSTGGEGTQSPFQRIARFADIGYGDADAPENALLLRE